MNIIELKQVSKVFRKRSQQTPILEDITLTVQRGEFVVLRGENGAGKTTLLNLILGLLKPSSGEIELMGFSPQTADSKFMLESFYKIHKFPGMSKSKN